MKRPREIKNINFINNIDDYVFEFKIKEPKRVRKIITYENDINGYNFKRFHRRYVLPYLEKAPSSKYSYAYKKGTCTKDAFKNHLKSNLFIKLDISKFFESISYDEFIKKARGVIKEEVKNDFKTCFYKGNLSIGFVTSPKISDIYMYKFDQKIEKYLSKFKNLHYSRYCDDILISAKDKDFGQLHTFKSYIVKELEKIGLSINDKKTREFDIDKDEYVKFLGLNLVGKPGKYELTVSKSFIVKTINKLKQYYELCEKASKKKNSKKLAQSVNTFKSICNSRVAYIKNNSDKSYSRFLKKHKNNFGFDWED